MSQRKSFAVGTGLFIVLGFASLAYLATQTSSIANSHQGAAYRVDAQFANIGQLKERAPVKVAGVRIGQVQSIALAPGKDVADVTLSIDKQYSQIPVDSVATIYTSGLLGDQYVGIQFGGAKTYVADGGHFGLTKSTQPLEEMLSKFIGGGGAADAIGGTYAVKANFTNVGTLSVGAPVKMAGVAIGSVASIKADPVKLDATVTFDIDKRYNQIPDDSAAAIFTSGLIGSQYVAIQPGGSPNSLKDGDQLVLTQSAMQLEDLIGKFLVSGSSGGSNNASGNGSSNTPTGKH
ncbi:outer membrane lipid asymmetry maintenance protein MlaD [Dyella psychrodurans]|uniref:Outer membrane lipid asymmetry maintenance protein MlaD n=1 Tax=Dyella psychrodurans TaxID=1927960 RepID=A0A370X2I2_9GAMM|nr:outer membrane lipid asymmetry maintenance protein MlaD [Dyella psychrodurans]RDS82566.1 outer membrane lipid asymmetry maintenance protein MlaD [Dyella psychrodurans]